MHTEIAFVILFAVATAVAVASRRLKIPYTVALVAAGLLLGAIHVMEPPHLTKEFLFAVILPGLIFEAAFHLEYKRFRENAIAINALAIPGVAAAIGLSAALLMIEVEAFELVEVFAPTTALVFGALIAATDPIAVVALFRTLGVPKRLMVLVEGESLLNDGTAVVFFSTILAVATGQGLSTGGAVLGFVTVVGMGALVGALVGLVISHVTRRIDDPMIEITLTVIAAYGSFSVAEQFHYSGVIATVVAGMLCGNVGARSGMSPTTRISVQSFWDYVAFALNSIVFLLIGFEVSVPSLLGYWKPILAAFVAVAIGRAIVVFAVSALLGRTRERLPWSWSLALTWAGLRGAISMVLVLGLAADFPNRELLVHMTFGVVVLSILVQGLSMNVLLTRLGIVGAKADYQDAYECFRGRLRAAEAALAEIKKLRTERVAHGVVLEAIEAEYEGRVRKAEAGIRTLRLSEAELGEGEERETRRRLLLVEKDEQLNAFHAGVVGREAFDELMADIDARLAELEVERVEPSMSAN